ncbi:MAG: hypothetical protein NT050_12905 [Verrucomicrobia bacterium]|nr:hypothetical protein [Verrucomicrobiota bacterium]
MNLSRSAERMNPVPLLPESHSMLGLVSVAAIFAHWTPHHEGPGHAPQWSANCG